MTEPLIVTQLLTRKVSKKIPYIVLKFDLPVFRSVCLVLMTFSYLIGALRKSTKHMKFGDWAFNNVSPTLNAVRWACRLYSTQHRTPQPSTPQDTRLQLGTAHDGEILDAIY